MTQDTTLTALYSKTIPEIVQKNKALYGNRIAFRDENNARTFSEFSDRCTALKRALIEKGIVTGDRIAILSRNRIEYMEVCCMSGTGAMIATLNWRLSYPELKTLMADCQAKVIIAETSLFERDNWPENPFADVPIRISLTGPLTGWLEYENVLSSAPNMVNITDNTITPKDGACIVYTSGTSGLPKGAIHTHESLIANARNQIEVLHLGPEDRTLSVMPLFHAGGMWYHAFPSFVSGAETIIHSRFKPQLALDLIVKYKVTNIHLVPTMVGDLISHDIGEAAKYLKTLFYAASPMPLQILKRTMAKFPNCAFVQCYGSTEGGSISRLTPEDHIQAVNTPKKNDILKSCGRAFSNVNIALRDDNGTITDSNTVGEIHIRAHSTMTSYWNNPEETQKTIQNQWIASGDLGLIDDDGYLYLVDRKNDMIITGGENVYPGEVEQVLYEFEGVTEACVIGVKDPRFIEKVVACVVVKAGVEQNEEAIIAFCKTRLAGYKCPKNIIFYDSLPRNGAGKILKRPLRDTLNNAAV